MGWYDSDWSFRAAITVDNSGAGSTLDVVCPIPLDWDRFWDNVQADGDDVRITAADGITLLSYDLSGWDYANKDGSLRVDAMASTATAGCYLIWVYWGNAAAADASSVLTISGPVDGFIHQGRPSSWRMPATPAEPGSTKPVYRIQKTKDEQIIWWVNFRPMLEKRMTTSQGRNVYEEPYGVSVDVQDGGSTQAGMFDQTAQRFVEDLKGDVWCGMLIKAGTDATDYTAEMVLTSALPEYSIISADLQQGTYRKLEPRALVRVEEISEA